MGELYIIGGGGSKDLITLKGFELLKKADKILYDSLVGEDLLASLDNEKLVYVGKMYERGHYVVQEEINRYLQEFLNKGMVVARLKGGDPAIFGRLYDEIDVAKKLNIPVTIVPGVTTASYFSSILKGSLTSRRYSSGVIFITGRTAKGDIKDFYDWKSIVACNFTIVVYMGSRNFYDILDLLKINGMDVGTPVAVGMNLGKQDEIIIVKAIDEFLSLRPTITNPAMIIIGKTLLEMEGYL